MLSPRDEQDVADAVREAAATVRPLAIAGGGTRRGLGRPMQTAATLSLAALTGVTLYEPAELVVSARAGTPLAEIEALLATNRQRLAFEPPDHRRFYESDGTPTIGAVAAANLCGPRRIQAGAARDGLIGIRVANGRGDIVKSGGRVMKNVTGYDLVKFLAGSYGTLGVLTEVTFKVLPEPESEATLILSGLDHATAVKALSAALGSPFGVTGAAHIPGESAQTLVRIDGFAASVAYRGERLRLLGGYGAAEIVESEASARLWKSVRDLDALAAPPAASVWRVSVRPSAGPALALGIMRSLPARSLFDWGGGLIWIAIDPGPEDAGAGIVRAAVRAAGGGHATLVRAPDAIRLAVDVFQPQSDPIMALTRKLKQSFDPAGILNPGRMYAGI